MKNPDLLEGYLKIAERGFLKNATEIYKEQLKEILYSGNIEYYFSQNYRRVSLGVTKAIGEIPKTYAELVECCAAIVAEYQKSSGITTRLYDCEFRNVAGVNAVYVVTEDRGSRMFAQYLVQTSPSILVLFTATAGTEVFETTKKEFDEIMKSLKLR